MSKRYYLCDVIGDGSEENPLRPAVADMGVNWVGEISEDGTKCLVLVSTVNHGPIMASKKADALPVFPLDAKTNAMNSAAKNALMAAMEKRGFATGYISGADGYREVVRGIGRAINPNFNENNFDVSE